jgi:predicted Zn-dependent protease
VTVDDATARAELPVTAVDRLHGEYLVAVLRNDWPFVPERRDTNIPAAANRIEEIAQAWFVGRLSWADAMKEALDEYQQQGNVVEAARVAVNLADAYVASSRTQYAAGQLLLRADAAARGLHYLQRAVHLDPATIEFQMSVAQAQFMLGRAGDSIATLERVLQQHPGEARAEYWLAEVRRRTQ